MHGKSLALGLLFAASQALAQTGVIEGTVKLLPRDQVKPSNPYLDPAASPRPMPTKPIPGVVFIQGEFAGQTFAPPEKHPTLEQKNTWFRPEVLAVLVGTTVDFPNLDDQYHNVFSYSKTKRFDLGRYPTGESRPVTFDKPGVVKIYCEVHSHMRAWVIVCENPYFAVTDESGNFQIKNVPPGKHKLVRWRSQGAEAYKEAEVTAGQTVTVSIE